MNNKNKKINFLLFYKFNYKIVYKMCKNSKKEILETSVKFFMNTYLTQRLINNKALDIEEMTMDDL